MKRIRTVGVLLISALLMAGCTAQIGGGEDGPTVVTVEKIPGNEQAQIEAPEGKEQTTTAETSLDTQEQASVSETATEESAAESDKITDSMALDAVKNYCFTMVPDLKEGMEAGTYNVSWEVESSDDTRIVVLYRSYTAAEVRYYIDRATGETHVTEFVSGITEEEQPTDESFNVRDYL
ncbi:MAG: hypothetical protein K5682_04130 [Lachnospiraceae bacterium]|nr:hypothetical protein [Lachnospiraceae bacterium]